MISIPLGSRVKDKISGFKGIVVARTEWLNGCWRYGVRSKELKDGQPIETQWFDDVDLEVIDKGKKQDSVQKGGDRDDPKRSFNKP